MKHLLFAIVASALPVLSTQAEEKPDSSALTHRMEFSGRAGYMMPTNPIVKGVNMYGETMKEAFGAALEYSVSFAPSTRYGKLYPTAYQGIGVSVSRFDESRLLGKPVNIYILQGAHIAAPCRRLTFDYEWNFGISTGWHKISCRDLNISGSDVDGLGSRLNAYIDLGFKLNFALSDRLDLTAGVNISHFSNGNTDYPNPGINVLWSRIGLVYRPGNAGARRRADWSGYERHISYDLTVYGAWRKHLFNPEYGDSSEPERRVIPGHFGLCGLNINPIYHFNPVFGAGLSFDMQYDDGANLSPYYEPSSGEDHPRFYRQPFSHRVMAGVSARIELQMPVFTVNAGVGHSCYAPGGTTLRGWYQTFTLKTFVTRSFFISTGYRLVRFKEPGNLMLGLGWRLHAK